MVGPTANHPSRSPGLNNSASACPAATQARRRIAIVGCADPVLPRGGGHWPLAGLEPLDLLGQGRSRLADHTSKKGQPGTVIRIMAVLVKIGGAAQLQGRVIRLPTLAEPLLNAQEPTEVISTAPKGRSGAHQRVVAGFERRCPHHGSASQSPS